MVEEGMKGAHTDRRLPERKADQAAARQVGAQCDLGVEMGIGVVGPVCRGQAHHRSQRVVAHYPRAHQVVDMWKERVGRGLGLGSHEVPVQQHLAAKGAAVRRTRESWVQATGVEGV